jgi:hypothetical protein
MRASTSAFFSGLLACVDQHHIDAGIGRHISNACAHHTSTQNANRFHRLIRGSGAVRALFQRLFVDEQAADHGTG